MYIWTSGEVYFRFVHTIIAMFMISCIYFQVAKDKPPVVGFLPLGSVPWLNSCFGGPHYPSVRSHIYTSNIRLTTVWEKTLNAIYYIIDDSIRYYYLMLASQQIAEQYVGQKIRPLYEIEKTINMVLLNAYPTFDGAIPLPPNAIEIGGMHTQAQSVDETKMKYSEVMYIQVLLLYKIIIINVSRLLRRRGTLI